MEKGSKEPQAKIDLARLYKSEYAAPKKPVLLDVGPGTYLSISGMGAPGGAAFEDRVGALYSMAFTIKMTCKFEGRGDYAVGRLEAQWWTEGSCGDFSTVPKEQWQWKVFIRTPEFITGEDLDRARAALARRGKGGLSSEVALETMAEGPCVQMLHVGPYDREKATIEQMIAFAADKGCAPRGLHHEIYISDPRRVPPERLKTILRHPVAKARPA